MASLDLVKKSNEIFCPFRMIEITIRSSFLNIRFYPIGIRISDRKVNRIFLRVFF